MFNISSSLSSVGSLNYSSSIIWYNFNSFLTMNVSITNEESISPYIEPNENIHTEIKKNIMNQWNTYE